jgi:hypothetical protein
MAWRGAKVSGEPNRRGSAQDQSRHSSSQAGHCCSARASWKSEGDYRPLDSGSAMLSSERISASMPNFAVVSGGPNAAPSNLPFLQRSVEMYGHLHPSKLDQ